jgi:hypothetical protein
MPNVDFLGAKKKPASNFVFFYWMVISWAGSFSSLSSNIILLNHQHELFFLITNISDCKEKEINFNKKY